MDTVAGASILDLAHTRLTAAAKFWCFQWCPIGTASREEQQEIYLLVCDLFYPQLQELVSLSHCH